MISLLVSLSLWSIQLRLTWKDKRFETGQDVNSMSIQDLANCAVLGKPYPFAKTFNTPVDLEAAENTMRTLMALRRFLQTNDTSFVALF